ncbi:cytochrome c [Euzebya sp.]|uniref:c-type cytochrome n=1 Tax=Euzebya sp. TaxID=1971409 RepID=UPI00351943D2
MSTITIAIVILAVGAAITLVLLLASSNARRKLSSSIPPAMRPAPADEELEGNHLERMLAWGLVLVLFFAVFLPVYWLREPTRAQDKQEGLFSRSFTTGEELYVANCAECHGADGSGGAAVSPYGSDSWPAPNLLNISARYAESRIVVDIREYIEETLHRGRPGTPMPTWGAAYGGPMTDFQIDAITDWILANQTGEAAEATAAVNAEGQQASGEELYLQNCARCHGAQLEGIVGPSLIGVTERHSDETILGILQNGISITGGGMSMPPWQEGYMYPDTRYDDESLNRIVEYLNAAQPDSLPEDAGQYQTPNVGEPAEPTGGSEADGGEAPDDEPTADPTDDTTEV